TLGKGLYSCHGQWLDRSCLEYRRSVTLQSGTVAVGRTETTWTTKKAGTPNRHAEQTSELPIACSAFGSSSQGGLMLDHQLVWLYPLLGTANLSFYSQSIPQMRSTSLSCQFR